MYLTTINFPFYKIKSTELSQVSLHACYAIHVCSLVACGKLESSVDDCVARAYPLKHVSC